MELEWIRIHEFTRFRVVGFTWSTQKTFFGGGEGHISIAPLHSFSLEMLDKEIFDPSPYDRDTDDLT